MNENLFLINIDYNDKIISLDKYKFLKSLENCKDCKNDNGNIISFCGKHDIWLKKIYLESVNLKYNENDFKEGEIA